MNELAMSKNGKTKERKLNFEIDLKTPPTSK
jgi:hypothetical protein